MTLLGVFDYVRSRQTAQKVHYNTQAIIVRMATRIFSFEHIGVTVRIPGHVEQRLNSGVCKKRKDAQ